MPKQALPGNLHTMQKAQMLQEDPPHWHPRPHMLALLRRRPVCPASGRTVHRHSARTSQGRAEAPRRPVPEGRQRPFLNLRPSSAKDPPPSPREQPRPASGRTVFRHSAQSTRQPHVHACGRKSATALCPAHTDATKHTPVAKQRANALPSQDFEKATTETEDSNPTATRHPATLRCEDGGARLLFPSPGGSREMPNRESDSSSPPPDAPSSAARTRDDPHARSTRRTCDATTNQPRVRKGGTVVPKYPKRTTRMQVMRQRRLLLLVQPCTRSQMPGPANAPSAHGRRHCPPASREE